MKKQILLAVIAASLFSSSSFADLAIGGYLGLNQAQPSSSDSGSYSGKQGSEIGALLLVPFIPTLSMRFGLAQKTRKTHYEDNTNFGGAGTSAAADISESLLDFGVGVQWDVPVTGLYFMGGAKISSSQSITCDVLTPAVVMNKCDKTKTDYPLFVGAGYDIIDLALVHFAIEGEYERGSSANFLGAKNNELTGRLLVKFGL